MALYNPIIGDIPQPKKNSNEVEAAFIPNSNYGAIQSVAFLNDQRVVLLETDAVFDNTLQTDYEQITAPIVLTHIILNRTTLRFDGGCQCSFNVYINNVKIMSYNDGTYWNSVSRDVIIPVNNCLFGTGTLFKIDMQGDNANGKYHFNCAFVGYTNTKL